MSNTFPWWSKDLGLRGHGESAPISTSEEENDAFPEKRIKTNEKSHRDWSESHLRATRKTRHRWEFLLELGMGRKGQLSPISPARALVVLLSRAAA